MKTLSKKLSAITPSFQIPQLETRKKPCYSLVCRFFIVPALVILCSIFIVSCGQPAANSHPVLHRLFLVKYKPEVTQAQIDENIQHFYRLKDEIPGILDVVSASDIKSRPKKPYTHVTIVSFANEDAVKDYEKHPIHKDLAKTGPALIENFFMVDYWTGKD